ncbi:MAG: Type II site-specific deoxyribonuclease [Candidatus Magnetoglobus multicellularis str. Araruama]|uniref:Type II site-specific deoxyribonuclease n=1 Tax=Candidatus Magnetoglobus multicellularis str. Araruama TaxID=890399 RepID=A0A1V1PFC0_9BACT|nr:MAG: Type II site-specific deoxyribonuclease [Candidatus Magnetoglobus multicellularis str. Araruama]
MSDAVAHYWHTLTKQAAKQVSGEADRGQRSAVTGGKQMDGFCDLINWICLKNGLKDADICLSGKTKLTIPGFFRHTQVSNKSGGTRTNLPGEP